MRRLRTFGKFWYDFVVGDDWRLAVGVVTVVAATAFAAHHGADWWWLLPLSTACLLTVSLRTASRQRMSSVSVERPVEPDPPPA